MTPPQDMMWTRDPHTAAKHQMLSVYLQAWFPIIASRFGGAGLTYAEGFAGPGGYLDGAEGSPLIALRQALRGDVTKHRCPIRILCVEMRQDRLDHLRELVASRFPHSPALLEFHPVVGSCDPEFLAGLQAIGAFTGPIFANLDGWGVDTPFEIVERIGSCKSSEVLVTFETQWFIRFASREHHAAGDRVFGDSAWRDVQHLASPGDKRKFLIDAYLAGMNAAGFDYTLTLELVDEGGHGLLLVFGTTSDRGVERMKDAMWRVDPVRGERFRDPRDVNQLSLDILEPDFSSLRRMLLEQLNHGPKSLAELKRFTLLHTIYRAVHAVDQVAHLVEDRKVTKTAGRRHEDVLVALAPPGLFG